MYGLGQIRVEMCLVRVEENFVFVGLGLSFQLAWNRIFVFGSGKTRFAHDSISNTHFNFLSAGSFIWIKDLRMIIVSIGCKLRKLKMVEVLFSIDHNFCHSLLSVTEETV